MLYHLFSGQQDKVRTDAAKLLSQVNSDNKMSKSIIDHIVEQVWRQYDYDGNGFLDEKESYDFLNIVLQLNESMLAKANNRQIREITEQEVRNNI